MSGYTVEEAWLIGAGCLVMIKYVGMSINGISTSPEKFMMTGAWTAAKIFDYCLNFGYFICLTWALAFGKSDGNMFAGTSQFLTYGLPDYIGGYSLIFFSFTISCIHLVVIAESVRYHCSPLTIPYQSITLIFGAIVFPTMLHWVWSDQGWASPYRSADKNLLLFGCGALDIGGSGVVHFSAGLAAAVFAYTLKPSHQESFDQFLDKALKRAGFVDEDSHDHGAQTITNTIDKHVQHNENHGNTMKRQFNKKTRSITRAMNKDVIVHGLSVFLIWIGTYGSGVMSNLAWESDSIGTRVSTRVINITLCAATAGFVAMIIGKLKIFPYRVPYSSDGLTYSGKRLEIVEQYISMEKLFGSINTSLVAITAGSGLFELEGSVAVGVLAAVLHYTVVFLQDLIHFENRSGAISIHMLGGAVGVLSVGLFTSSSKYYENMAPIFSNNMHFYNSDSLSYSSQSRTEYCSGAFYGGTCNQLLAQLVYLLSLIAWEGTIMFLVAHLLKYIFENEYHTKAHKNISDTAIKMSEMFSDHLKLDRKALVTRIRALRSDFLDSHFADMEGKPSITPRKASAIGDTVDTSAALVRGNRLFEHKYGYGWDAVMMLPIGKQMAKRLGIYDDLSQQKAGLLGSQAPDMDKVDEEVLPDAEDIENLLQAAGLGTYCYYSLDKRCVIMKVRCGLDRLRTHADLMGMPFLLNHDSLQKRADLGYRKIDDKDSGREVLIKPFQIEHDDEHSRIYPYSFIYGNMEKELIDNNDQSKTAFANTYSGNKIDATNLPPLYAYAAGYSHEMGSIQRLKIIDDIVKRAINITDHDENDTLKQKQDLENNQRAGVLRNEKDKEKVKGDDDDSDDDSIVSENATLSYTFDQLLQRKAILAWFPLPHQDNLQRLAKEIFSSAAFPKDGAQDLLRDYFGEEIALYFKFLTHYIRWLVPISIVGVGAVVHIIYNWYQIGNYYASINSSTTVVAFAVILCCWCNLMLRGWTGVEKSWAMRWGTTEFEETEQELSDYKGVSRPSFIDGQPMKYVDIVQQNTRRRVAALVVTTAASVVVGINAAAFYLKFQLVKNNQADLSAIVDVVNALSIAILDFIYKRLAFYMTEYENCRTQTDFNDSMITKLFLFSFFNSYAPAIYIAYIKKLVNDECLYHSCIGELGRTMLIIFTARSVGMHVATFISPKIPRIWNYLKICCGGSNTMHHHLHSSEVEDIRTVPEVEFMKPRFKDVFTDYNEITIQFGYMALFSVAFPLAPALALASNFVEFRVDGNKLLKDFRRPWPQPAEDIGTWYTIFDIIANLSIITNAGIIAWTMDLFGSNSSGITRLSTLIVFAVGTIVVRTGVTMIQEAYDVSYVQAEIQLQRQEFLVKKIVKKSPDEFKIESEDIREALARKERKLALKSAQGDVFNVYERDISEVDADWI